MSDPGTAERLRLAADLHEFGVLAYRQRLRRGHPDWDDRELDEALRHWLSEHPLQGPPAPAERWQRLVAAPRRDDHES